MNSIKKSKNEIIFYLRVIGICTITIFIIFKILNILPEIQKILLGFGTLSFLIAIIVQGYDLFFKNYLKK